MNVNNENQESDIRTEFNEILNELYKDSSFHLPFKSEENLSYMNSLDKRIEKYHASIKALKTNGIITNFLKENLDVIWNIKVLIKKCLSVYLLGRYGESYDILEDLLNEPILIEYIRYLKMDMTDYTQIDNQKNALFRIRDTEDDIENCNQIFHLPFNMSHKVKMQRYSIAGVPCLYLGESLLACWYELGKPSTDDLYISRFNIKGTDKVEVIDFAYSIENLMSFNTIDDFYFGDDVDENVLKAYLLLYPLNIACSYTCKYQIADFNAEYIIPNMFLQWIRTNKSKVDGIRYLSTKALHFKKSKLGFNYVFPTSSTHYKEVGYCDSLCKKFQLTKPVPWNVLKMFREGAVVLNDISNKYEKDIYKTIIENYTSTEFSMLEQRLKNTPLNDIFA